MTELAVVAFPEFASESERWIEAVRLTYDPLAASVAPHVTLVFPTPRFDVRELTAAMEAALDGVLPLSVTFRGIEVSRALDGSEWVVYLVADRGNDELTDWHLRLHAGELVVLRAQGEPFRPHITIGRFDTEKAAGIFADPLAPLEPAIEGRIDAIDLIEISKTAIRPIVTMPLAGRATFRL